MKLVTLNADFVLRCCGSLGIYLRRMFEIPAGCSRLWLTVHDRPGRDRWKGVVCLGSCWSASYPEIRIVDLGKCHIDEGTFDERLRRLVGRTVYVQCEYEHRTVYVKCEYEQARKRGKR